MMGQRSEEAIISIRVINFAPTNNNEPSHLLQVKQSRGCIGMARRETIINTIRRTIKWTVTVRS
jgi:hypothetical protein